MVNFKYFILFTFTYTIPQYNNNIYLFNCQHLFAQIALFFYIIKEKTAETPKEQKSEQPTETQKRFSFV